MNSKKLAIESLCRMSLGEYEFELDEYYFFRALVDKVVSGLSYEEACDCLTKIIDTGLAIGQAEDIVYSLSEELDAE